jgi:signal peptidase I
MNNKKVLTYYIILIVLICISIFTYKTYLNRKVIIEGDSMYPSIKNGDAIYINTLTHKFKTIERNTIVVFKHNNKTYCERVIGLPNETISMKECNFYINGEQIITNSQIDRYLKVMKLWIQSGQTTPIDFGPLEIPSETKNGEDHYYVIGDYILSSEDSREFGPIPKSSIIGTSQKY